MIYGYDEAQLFPVQSLYDTGMINMYLNAVKGEYERGIADQKEFISKYGDFISPFSKDVEAWDKATLGGYRDLVNNLKQQGIDPIRSQEGRAAIQNFILSRPYGDLAKLKQAAKTGEQYSALLAKGIADGTLDYNTAVKLDGDFRNWSTLQNGIWDKVAPTAQKSINDVLAPYIQDLNKYGYKYDPEASKQRGYGYIVHTVSDDAIRDELNKNAIDIMKDPMMQLRAKELGMTPEEFIQSQLYTHMRRELTPKESEDKVLFEREKLGIEKSKLGLEKQRLNLEKQKVNNDEIKMYLDAGYQIDGNGNLIPPTVTSAQVPLSLHQESDYSAATNRNIHLGGGPNGGNAVEFEKRLNEYIAYYSTLLDTKHGATAKKNIEWATRMKKEGFDKAVKNGFFTVNKLGDYVPTEGWSNAISKVENKTHVSRPKYNEAKDKAINYRNTYQAGVFDEPARLQSATKFAGTGTIQKNIKPGDGIKNRAVHLSASNIIFTPHRALQYGGYYGEGRSFRDIIGKGLAEKFSNYVRKKNIIGYYTDSSHSQLQIVSAPRSNGGRSFEIDAPLWIESKDISAFAENQNMKIGDVIRQLGLVGRDAFGREVEGGKLAYKDVVYYEAPFTRVENNNTTNESADIDIRVDKARYGQAQANKLIIDRQAKSAARQ